MANKQAARNGTADIQVGPGSGNGGNVHFLAAVCLVGPSWGNRRQAILLDNDDGESELDCREVGDEERRKREPGP